MATETGNPFVEKYLTPLAVLLGAIIIAVAFAFGSGGSPTPPGQPSAEAVDIQDVKTDNSPFVGQVTAPVTIAVWFDYQCPFCKRFELETLKQVYDKYVTAGKVRIVYKDFQFLGPDSDTAAVFARAVWEAHPDRFHEWNTAVMTAQDEEHGGFGDLESITTLTRTIVGIDTDRVLALMGENRGEYEAAIAADRAEGQTFGINGTPGAIIGTSLVAGAQPYAQVEALIEAELAQ
ncbi:thioredoxin domain-containing protein [Candidatus Parcubacteria bacterium]|nr:thioredoxin domain-containing protein [Candidatus Parcubacteria bacterium]